MTWSLVKGYASTITEVSMSLKDSVEGGGGGGVVLTFGLTISPSRKLICMVCVPVFESTCIFLEVTFP